MVESKYKGTKNLDLRVSLNRLYELLDKSPLGGNDEDFYLESKELIEKEFKQKSLDSSYWNKVKDKLTAKQLLYVLEGEK